MFAIRVFAPPSSFTVTAPQVTGELIIGEARRIFRLDLRYWRIGHYQRQWRAGIGRLLYGARSSALMIAFRPDEDAPHLMWALWREAGRVFVQPHCVTPRDLCQPFDPFAPYAHVESRVPATEQALPISEWSIDADAFFAAALRLRWPFAS